MTYQPTQHKVLIESQSDQHLVGVRNVSEGDSTTTHTPSTSTNASR